jgi:hypothetical protein
VTEIIQHVKYSVLMARVAEIAQNGKTYVRYQLPRRDSMREHACAELITIHVSRYLLIVSNKNILQIF